MVEQLSCANCQTTDGVELEASRTEYVWDGTGTDPNAPVPLCRPCAEMHHTYWNDMWAEYYQGRL